MKENEEDRTTGFDPEERSDSGAPGSDDALQSGVETAAGSAGDVCAGDAGAPADDGTLREARRDIVFGTLWCVGGLAFSFASYYFTEAGGRYVVATGAVLWGVVQALRGVWGVVRHRYRSGDAAGAVRAVCLTVAAMALVGWLAVLSNRAVHEGEAMFVECEQTAECDSLRLKALFPAGFTEVEYEYSPGTDDDFAAGSFWAGSETMGMRVEGILNVLADDVESVGDIYDYCASRDSTYYDGGISLPTTLVKLAGREWLHSEGMMADSPGWVFALYDMIRDRDLVSVSIWYDSSVVGKSEAQRTANLFLRSVESTE